ncbi:MAG: AI-2E family transporter [Bacteroidota bacterium]|nr:AI-2E family transporter [Bacteroidota bacterium]
MESTKPLMRPESPYLRWIQYIFFGSLLLYFGRDILIPLSFALLISFVLYPICAWLEERRIGKLTAILLSVSLLIVLGLLLIGLLVSQFVTFISEWPSLYTKINQSLEEVNRFLVEGFNLSSDQQKTLVARVSSESGNGLFAMIRSGLRTSASSMVMFFLIPVYAVLILYYRRQWMQVLFRLFPSEDSGTLRAILSLTIQTYYNFIKGMAIVYLIVGILNSIGLLLLGVPHAFFFGFVASILTFIPYVGIIVGSLLPITMAWITFDSIWYPLGIVGVFTFVQYLEANVIFPLAVSRRLNVNTLVMLFAIFAGGIIWGMAGMILFVPFVGIAKLIADHNPQWKTASMILGVEKPAPK